MPSPKTVMVRDDDSPLGYMIINETNFREGVHELFVKDQPKAESTEASEGEASPGEGSPRRRRAVE